MKRVAHLSSVHAAHDVRIFVKQCRSLAAAGYDVTLIARGDGDCVKNSVKIETVNRLAVGRLRRMLVTIPSVLRKGWRCRADVYHIHDPELIPVGALLRMMGAKVIYDVHEDLPKQILSKAWMPAILRKPMALALSGIEWFGSRFIFTHIVAATPSIARRFPSKKTCTVQNFPIVDELVPQRRPVPMTERRPYVVYAGGMMAVRGIREMVTAMERVETPGARLVLAGEFMEPSLEEQVRALAGWQRTELRGWLDRPGIARLLGEARVGLVLLLPEPNYLTSYPIKLFEYMSASLPVIASNFPLWRSIVEGTRSGLVVDPQDPTAIASAIDWMLGHPEEAKSMGQRGREAVETTYNWAAEEDKLLTMYRNLLCAGLNSLPEPEIGLSDARERKRHN